MTTQQFDNILWNAKSKVIFMGKLYIVYDVYFKDKALYIREDKEGYAIGQKVHCEAIEVAQCLIAESTTIYRVREINNEVQPIEQN